MVILFFWVGFAAIIAVIANNKGRNPAGWFFLALLISPLLAGLFLGVSNSVNAQPIASGTMKPCPRCAESVQRAAQVCKHCGHEFDDSPRVAPASARIDPYEMWRTDPSALSSRLSEMTDRELVGLMTTCNMEAANVAHNWSRADLIKHIQQQAKAQ
jgi:hypothetical protein